MPDTEAFIERLTAENHEFRTLRDEHHSYEEELAALNTRGFLSRISMARERAEEAQAHRERPDGGHDPARARRDARLSRRSPPDRWPRPGRCRLPWPLPPDPCR